jgi:hypothetical protein
VKLCTVLAVPGMDVRGAWLLWYIAIAMLKKRPISGTTATFFAHALFARSRSANFWIFPVLVFGTSVNTTWRGTL